MENSENSQFNISSGLLKAYQGKDGKKRLKTVASSTITDRAGDAMSEIAIRKMADSAKENMTIFLNHSYRVPEDVFGSVEDVQVVRRGDVWDLEFDVRLNEANDRAIKTYEAIENGTKLGTSIGAKINEGGAKRNDTGGFTFDDISLLEASIVALPSNPRSWVHHALKALKTEEEDDELLTVGEAGPEIITKVELEVPVQKQDEPEPEPAPEVSDPDGSGQPDPEELNKAGGETAHGEHELDDRDWEHLPEGDQAEADALYAEMDLVESGELDIEKAELTSRARGNLSASDFACPEKRKYPIHDKAHIRNALARCADSSNDQCGCGKVRAAARRAGIGTDKADELIVTLSETPQAAQDGQATAPESADGETPLTTVVKADEDFSVLSGAFDALKIATSELVDLRKELTVQTESRVRAETERDAAVADLRKAQAIIEQVASLPIGRRHGFDEGIRDFRARFSNLYSDDFLKLLETDSE